MRHYPKLTLAVGATLLTLSATAQTDVTADYISNPSFEDDATMCTDAVRKSEAADGLRGWDVSAITGWATTRPDKQLLITADCFTDNNFGKTAIADGQYALFQRMGWNNGNSAITQTTSKAVPAGKYLLTLKVKAFYANGGSSAVAEVRAGSRRLATAAIDFEKGSNGCMGSAAWRDVSLRFTLTEATAISIATDITWVSGGSQIAIDDVRLWSLPDDTPDPQPTPTQFTEGVITHDFVPEAEMMQDLLQMLARSMQYAKSIWFQCQAPNSVGEACGYFKGNSAGQNNEDGVRTNADFAMISAFLIRYAQGKVTLPEGVTWDDVRDMAMRALVFGYSTHKANKLKVTSNNAYWGSTSTSDNTWESSLWTMSLCYAAHFLDDQLTDAQRAYIYNMVKAECNYELGRTIPTGYAGDTKAEENGWEADVLACALGLYPDDALAARWFDRLRAFAINSYSQANDATDDSVIDPDYDQKTVADYYRGQNLYDDYTLQNHNLFHTSYQNVVMQELGEAHLAMLLFQGSNQKWQTNALMHNQQAVFDLVLKRLALADGELAMPNGNDWSLFLFDQITSYSTAACFLRDADALMLENMAYKYIKARQQTTTDGSWLLNSDIGPRRMGVEGHRVMMTYLMHLAASTASMTPSTWDDFSARQQDAHLFRSQNIVRAASKDRFVTFSWSNGLKSYTGYFTDTTPDRNKIICPFRANNTGNIIGWYNISGSATNATPTVSGIYDLHENAFTMNGRLETNDAVLENSFAVAATRGNAVVYLNNVKALQGATLTGRRGGLLAITTDPFTAEQRTIYSAEGVYTGNGAATQTFATDWANIDQSIGIVALGATGEMAFADRALNNSIQCAKFYPIYSQKNETLAKGKTIDRTAVIYYSRVDADKTQALKAQAISLADQLPDGWNGLRFADADGTPYLVVANLGGGEKNKAQLADLSSEYGAPVLTSETIIDDSRGTATIALDADHTLMQPLTVYVKGSGVAAKMFNPWDDKQLYIRTTSLGEQTVTVTILDGSKVLSKEFNIDGTTIIRLDNGEISAYVEEAEPYEWTDVTAQYIANPNFEEDVTWGTTGSITLGSTTYNPCYTQTVKADNAQLPQVLPVVGWTAASQLAPASNFALLYSMPYSFTQYCVSPSNLGNSASIMALPAAFEDEVGRRCLSILNSWTIGTNAVSQTTTLPAGTYELTFDMRYACPNESRRTAPNVITTTGGNTNTLLCGIVLGSEEHYVPYPTAADTWERLTIPFSLNEDTQTTIRLGLATTANQGAANQTRIYVDNVRLRKQTEAVPVGIETVRDDQHGIENRQMVNGKYYDLSGRRITSPMPHQLFISNGRKNIK